MSLTTEALLTHPAAFGLTTATPGQRAVCRALDGLPLGELADDAEVQSIFGGEESTRALPTGAPPREVHQLAAIRTAKTLGAAALAIRATQSVDVSGCARGDIVRFGVVSLKLENTRAFMSHLVANLQAKALLRPLVIGDPDDLSLAGVVLRHPSGRPIEIVPVPLDRAGGSLTSVWLAGVFVDEEPRMIGAEDGVRNWDHARDASMGRLLPGAQFYGAGSPWAPFGPIYDRVQEYFGKPSPDLVIMRARGRVMNPHHWTPERCADLERTNPTAARTDEAADFADPETALITGTELDAVKRAAPLVLPPEEGRIYFGAIDPATRRNAFTVVFGTADGTGEKRRTRIVLAKQWTPKGGRLDPEDVFRQIAEMCRPYRLASLATDQFSIDANTAIARRYGVALIEHVTTAETKLAMFEALRSAIARECFELCPDPVVRADLLSVRKRVTQAGVAIHFPTTSDGRHADYAPAVALVHHLAGSAGRPNFMSAGRAGNPTPGMQLLAERAGPDRMWDPVRRSSGRGF